MRAVRLHLGGHDDHRRRLLLFWWRSSSKLFFDSSLLLWQSQLAKVPVIPAAFEHPDPSRVSLNVSLPSLSHVADDVTRPPTTDLAPRNTPRHRQEHLSLDRHTTLPWGAVILIIRSPGQSCILSRERCSCPMARR